MAAQVCCVGMADFGCRECFQATAEAAWDARSKFTFVSELIDESHFHVVMLSCPRCGQHCVSVFTETIDWVDSEDPQYWSVLPLTLAESEALRAEPTPSRLESLGAGRCCLKFDSPKEGPRRVYWSRGPIRAGMQ